MALAAPKKNALSPAIQPLFTKAVDAVRGKSGQIEDALATSVNASRVGGSALTQVNEVIQSVAGEMIGAAANAMAFNDDIEELLQAALLGEALNAAAIIDEQAIGKNAAAALNNFGQNPEEEDFGNPLSDQGEAANDDAEKPTEPETESEKTPAIESPSPDTAHLPQTAGADTSDDVAQESSKLPVKKPSEPATPEAEQPETETRETEAAPEVPKTADDIQKASDNAWTDDNENTKKESDQPPTEKPAESPASTPEAEQPKPEQPAAETPKTEEAPEEPKKPEENPMTQSEGQPLVPTNEYGQPNPKPDAPQTGQPDGQQNPNEQQPPSQEQNNPDGQPQPGQDPNNPNAASGANPPQRGILTQGLNHIIDNKKIKELKKEMDELQTQKIQQLKKIKKLDKELKPFERRLLLLRLGYWSLRTIQIVLYVLAAILAMTIVFLIFIPLAPPVWSLGSAVGSSASAVGTQINKVKEMMKEKEEERDKEKKKLKGINRKILENARKRQLIINKSLLAARTRHQEAPAT